MIVERVVATARGFPTLVYGYDPHTDRTGWWAVGTWGTEHEGGGLAFTVNPVEFRTEATARELRPTRWAHSPPQPMVAHD